MADESTQVLLRAGAEERLIMDFRTIAEATLGDGSRRHPMVPVLVPLARFIVGLGGGPNRDAPLFELCHLINAVDACGRARDRRVSFFLGLGINRAQVYRHYFQETAAEAGWSRGGFSVDEDGVTIHYAESEFTIRFGRMPFLVGVFELLVNLEEMSTFADVIACCDQLCSGGVTADDIKTATQDLARLFRQYRAKYLPGVRRDGKFQAIYDFLARAKGGASSFAIDDQAILDFWLQQGGHGDFRLYQSAFEGVLAFVAAVEMAKRREAMASPARIGTDRASGEVEPEVGDADFESADEWQSPLADLDEPAAARVNFLKNASERKPLEGLMRYGPRAADLALAFLRVEAFGSVQSAILTDIRFKRPDQDIEKRITCADTATYEVRCKRFGELRELIADLQKATFFVLDEAREKEPGQAEIIPFPKSKDIGSANAFDDRLAQSRADAQSAFRKINRRGFENSPENPDERVESFRSAADALLSMGSLLDRFLKEAERADQMPPGFAQRFEQDKALFSQQFQRFYGDRS